MTIFQAFILGIVQGLTELLPISSSAHLNLIPWICGWQISESFDVALHFGTLIAIVVFFYNDWITLIQDGIKTLKIWLGSSKKTKTTHNGKMFWYIVIATIPGGIIGFLLDYFIGDELANMPMLIAIMLIIMGIILRFIDKHCSTKTEYENMNFWQTFIIGISQALAFIPGVSRSGITMTTGRMMGVSREGSARFSFMLSTPIVLGATLYKVKDFAFDMPFLVGVITSSVVGMLVIRFLLEYLQKGDFKVFAIYRVIIGVIVIVYWFIR